VEISKKEKENFVHKWIIENTMLPKNATWSSLGVKKIQDHWPVTLFSVFYECFQSPSLTSLALLLLHEAATCFDKQLSTTKPSSTNIQ